MRRLLRALGLAALAVFILLPLVQVVQLSFVSTLTREGIPIGTPTWLNYPNVFATDRLAASLVNSVVYVMLNVSLCIAVALPAAYAFSRYRFREAGTAFFALLAFRVTPPVVLSLPVFLVFTALDLINTPVGVALAHCVCNVPIAIWILESFISAVPREYDETAFLNGYSVPRFILLRLVPVIAPGIGTSAFFCFVFYWVEVVFARTLTVTDGKTISTAITSLFSFQTDIGLVMAMTVLSLLPGLAMIWFVRGHIARGFAIRL